MTLLQRIEKEFVTAYKAKDELKVAVLRMLKTAIKNVQVELQRLPEDDEVLDIIIKQVKQRKDSDEQYTKAGREDLAVKERAEITVLQTYLPEPVTGTELVELIDRIIEETGASGMKDMGKVMKAVQAIGQGRVDGKEASSLVRERLTS